jgi:hypothetical protein
VRRAAPLALAMILAACATTTGRIENGVFYSSKGYQVRLPNEGWRVEHNGQADLELRRKAPPGGMLANATCDGREVGRPADVLARHLTFGLTHRETLQSARSEAGGRQAVRTIVRGTTAGAEVTVEAVVIKDGRCVYDFLYVAPVAAFEAGRGDFEAFVGSFAGAGR